MTMEVGNLLSQAVLDAPGPGSKKANPVVILTPPPHRLKELLQPVDASSQASTQEEAKMAEASLEGVPPLFFPSLLLPGLRESPPLWMQLSSGKMPIEPLTSCWL